MFYGLLSMARCVHEKDYICTYVDPVGKESVSIFWQVQEKGYTLHRRAAPFCL